MKHPVISICIPTYGRTEILNKALISIFSQNVEAELFEVCIADNSPTDETKTLLAEKFNNKENIIYKKNNSPGFFNSIEALRLGRGKFLKLSNNYTSYYDGKLNEIIEFLKKEDTDSVVFFLPEEQSGSIKGFSDFNSLLNDIHYFSSWSTSFGIWRNDFELLDQKEMYYDKMFPHVSLLFKLYGKKRIVLNKNEYYFNQKISGKGGYNLPEVFGVGFLDMVIELKEKGVITKKTLRKIRIELLKFISLWNSLTLFDSKISTYDFNNYRSHLKKNYSNLELFAYEGLKSIYLLKHRLKQLIKK